MFKQRNKLDIFLHIANILIAATISVVQAQRIIKQVNLKSLDRRDR